VRVRPAKKKRVDAAEEQEIECVAKCSAAAGRRDDPSRLHENIGRGSRIRNSGQKVAPRGLSHDAIDKSPTRRVISNN
jgi:hypothetical protein